MTDIYFSLKTIHIHTYTIHIHMYVYIYNTHIQIHIHIQYIYFVRFKNNSELRLRLLSHWAVGGISNFNKFHLLHVFHLLKKGITAVEGGWKIKSGCVSQENHPLVTLSAVLKENPL